VWTKVQKSTNAPQYAIRTEAATAVARGTEFGVKIQRAASTNSSGSTTVLTVKEGAVDFSNSLGSVQATAMTESIATPDTAPTQPVLLKTIKTFDIGPGKQLTVEAQASVFDLDEFMYRMVYPQGWAGIYVRSIQDENDAAVRQLRIVRVWPGSPAEQAGIVVGDVITQVNGQPVTKVQEVLGPIFQQQGVPVDLSISRAGLSRTVSLVTTNHPYAVPISEMSPALAKEVFDATWPLIAARCQEEFSNDQWREMGRQFRNVLDRYPGAAAVHNNLGVWHQINQEVGPAIQQLQQAIASDPNNPLYHYNLSRVLASIGNFERCAEEAEAVVKLVPDWVPGIVQIAEAYVFLGRRDDAVAALERGLGANPSSAVLWCVNAYGLLSTQRLDEALVAVLKAAELEPSSAVTFTTLASVYWGRGQPQESEAASRKAIELDPGNPEAYANLAMDIIARLGNRQWADPTDAQPEDLAIERWRDRPAEELAIIAEAEHMSRKAIELKPTFVGAHVNLGNILLLRGAVEEAEKVLRKAIELDPHGQAASAYNNLAYHFAIWGIRLDEALQLAQHAVQLAPEGGFVDTLAIVHFRRGEWDQAEAAWKKCIELGGPQGDPGASFHLGRLYERQNRPDAAVAAYQEALRLRPEYSEASKALEKLRR
jgi:tetratricopeptide (TPR) repeat protein